MNTQEQNYTSDRMKREELQMDDDRDVREVRDADVIETRGEEVKPLITPAAMESERDEREQTAAPSQGSPVPNAGFGMPNLPEDATSHAGDRWQQIQAEFVDDPRKAVGDAHQLVNETVQRIVDAFTRERNELESQWSKGSDVSTEDLRLCLQHYRAFFSRLAPTVSGIERS